MGEHWRGVPITEIYGAQSPWGAPDFPLVSPSYNHTVLYHIPSHDDQHDERPPKPQIGHDKWDHEYVRMPCSSQSLYNVEENGVRKSKKRWLIIEEALSKPITNSEELALAILSYNVKFKTVWKFRALHKLFNDYLEDEETQYFFNVTLPAIAKLALDLPKVIKTAIPLLKQHKNRSISLSQQQIASLLANAFFCTFPRRNSTKNSSEYASYPYINFNALYECHGSESVLEKLKCLCHYFRRVTTKVPAGVVSFIRRGVGRAGLPRWAGCERAAAGAPLHVCATGTIEDQGRGLIQVDFANKYLGGGVLGRGCVQEEIRFVICPELMVSMLFTEVLGPTEALLMIGSERYSDYSGYGGSFRWSGDHVDETPTDSSRRRRAAVLAIDATPFPRPTAQYAPDCLLRELNKAWVGMSFFAGSPGVPRRPGVATGNWGCGAFGGCARLKALLQIMVAAHLDRPLAYFTFGDIELRNDIINMYNLLATHNVTIGELFGYISKFPESEAKYSELYAFIHQSLIDRHTHDEAVHMDVSNTEAEEVEQKNASPDLFSEEFNCSFTEENKDLSAILESIQERPQNQKSVTEKKDEIKIEMPAEDLPDPSKSELIYVSSKMDEVSSVSSSPDLLPQNKERVSKSLNQTSRLFEEMQRIDEESGSLNLKKPHEKALPLTEGISLDDSFQSPLNTSGNEKGFLASNASEDVKKKISRKITDYFSKK